MSVRLGVGRIGHIMSSGWLAEMLMDLVRLGEVQCIELVEC